jgi:hypothetical protein
MQTYTSTHNAATTQHDPHWQRQAYLLIGRGHVLDEEAESWAAELIESFPVQVNEAWIGDDEMSQLVWPAAQLVRCLQLVPVLVRSSGSVKCLYVLVIPVNTHTHTHLHTRTCVSR